MEILGKLKEWLTLDGVPLCGVTIASASILFAPSQWLGAIGLDPLMAVARPYIGGALVLTSSLLIAMLGKNIWVSLLRDPLKEALNVRVWRKELVNLTDDEKSLLSKFILNKTRSQNFTIQNAVALGLQQRMIIVRMSNIGLPGYGMYFPFQIQPWAWEHLNKHKHLLDLS